MPENTCIEKDSMGEMILTYCKRRQPAFMTVGWLTEEEYDNMDTRQMISPAKLQK